MRKIQRPPGKLADGPAKWGRGWEARPARRQKEVAWRWKRGAICAVIDKVMASPAEAVDGIKHGSTVLIGGFGTAGMPFALIDALIAQGAGELVIVSNNAGNGDT